ncbi:uncharacterized protein LOC135155748 [Lytechinus pictus]|uniref:uncharacterized protein LOC135155748 n=1 Tax=Lytechinus pictus TaxID=7653 RepID=UPI0030B9DC14
MVTLDALFRIMAMKSELRSAYGGCNLDTKLSLLEVGGEGTSSSSKPKLSHNNTPFLPRIRVEECGLTVEARDRDSWKRLKGTGMRCWKPGKRRKSKNKGEDDKSLTNAPTLPLRDGFHTQEQREEECDAHSVKSSSSSLYQCPTSAFIGSLQVGSVPFSHSRARENTRMARAIRWPIGCLKYSTPHSSSTSEVKTDSLMSVVESSKQRLLPLVPSPSAPLKTPSNVSPRERVILHKLASKRKQQLSQRLGKNNNGTNITGSSPESRLPSPIDFDQFLPTTHCAHLVNITSSTTQPSSKYILRSDGLYDIIDDATQARLEKLHGSSSTASLSLPIERVSSGSNTNTSGYESVKGISTRTLHGHKRDCPLCNDFKPSDVGHFCPPNTPDDVTSHADIAQ